MGEATYYLYDRNGNLQRTIASVNFPVYASSSLQGWEPYRLGDNNESTLWSSDPKGTATEAQWIVVDGGHPQAFGGITLTPRGRLAFPVEFKFQYSDDALNWTDIPGQLYSNFVNDGKTHVFTFNNPVLARYIRVYATTLGKDDFGNYYFQLAEVKANLASAVASSQLDGWEAPKAVDGNTSNGWSSHAHPTDNGVEWIVKDLGSSQMVGGVELFPRSRLGFPQDFRIQYSNDASMWTDIPGQTYTGYINDGTKHTFTFINPLIARYIRVYATKLGLDDMGHYYFQL